MTDQLDAFAGLTVAPPAAEREAERVPVALPSVERVKQAHAELRKKHEAKISHLAPQLKDLAFRRGDYGVDASDTRSLALKAGLVTGSEKELRALSWFACVPRRAGLIAAGPRTEWNPQGNRHTRYLHPTFCTAEQLERASRKRTRRAA